MKKTIFFVVTVLCYTIAAGFYGMVHDQITFSISDEYFTKFKYGQFGFDPAWFGGHRQTVAIIGFLATWWMGAIIGTAIAAMVLTFKNNRANNKVVIKTIAIILSATVISEATGFLYGLLYLTRHNPSWSYPPDLINPDNFIIVGSMHNFGYLGGLLGLIISVLYLNRLKNQAAISE